MGIFQKMSENLPWEETITFEDVDYSPHTEITRTLLDLTLLTNSSSRIISPLLAYFCELDDDNEYYISDENLVTLADYLYDKYYEKWKRVYTDILLIEYNPTHNYDGSETETITTEKAGTESQTEGGNDTTTKSGNTTNVRSGSETDGKGTTTTTKRSGYNSSTYSPDNEVAESGSDTITYNNVTDVETYNSISDKTTYGHTNTLSFDDRVDTVTRTLTKGGNLGATKNSELIGDDIDLRNKYNVVDMVAKDVSSELTISIY